ncbi:MAG TPA: 2-amino-4-hydroxy-6-hydroxymethyldihydropteridine diphosphokinase [Burkholderiaceae bacterium]|jgi:2-amino-4-hydroxy-6-hydroxymethyldihydropteridine diphosphokinase
MARAYIGLGANLGDMALTLRAALKALDALPRTRVEAVSSAWRSAPVDAGGPDYLNAVARLETELEPEPLLDALQAIELTHGRERPYVNAPRTLDLDLLLYDDQHVHTARLTVPHPRLHERSFVLRPLLEVAPERQDLAAHLPAVADQALQKLSLNLQP